MATWRVFPEAVELLQRQFEVDAVDTDEGLNREELVAWAADCHGIVSQLT